MHGGIGRSINHVEQIENIQRPITMEAGSIVLMDLLWFVDLSSIFMLVTVCFMLINGEVTAWDFFPRSDPTENDSVEGLRPNARGPGLVTFGVSVASLLQILWLFQELANVFSLFFISYLKGGLN